MAAVPAWLAAVEAVLERGLHGSARAAAVARRLDGTALGIEIDGMMNLRASMAAGRLALDVSTAPSNATISGSPFALWQLARGGATGKPGHSAAQVRGDAEIANLYRELFALGRPDVEEELARFIGDLPGAGRGDASPARLCRGRSRCDAPQARTLPNICRKRVATWSIERNSKNSCAESIRFAKPPIE